VHSTARRGRRSSLAAAATAAVGLAVAGCAPGHTSGLPTAPSATGRLIQTRLPSLDAALRSSTDLGRVSPTDVLSISLGLEGRRGAELTALVDAGRRLTPAAFAASFGPDPVAVDAVQAVLRTAGLRSRWQPGQTTLEVTGSAASVQALFNVTVDNFVSPGGTRFYASPAQPTVPSTLRPEVTSVAGLESYPNVWTEDLRTPDGLRPIDASDFYDVTPLQKAGLNGTGETIYLVEIDEFDRGALAKYAQKFKLPPFDITVKADSAAWGDPQPEGGSSETDLDVEIIHAMAPMAKMVIYNASGKGDDVDVAMRALLHDHPGAIVSMSLGSCEIASDKQIAPQDDAATQAAAATGTTIFVSSGDRGAYECVPDGDNSTIAPSFLSALPSVTSVGGTSAFLSASGGYGKESAWGEPAEQWGSGGGNSRFFKRPSWQVGPGVVNQYSNGGRQQPDVAGNADILSGWDIIGSQGEGPVGGTSAAAPFWAAITALIDQDLTQLHLASVGFANPALYLFAQAPQGLPANPFNDITTGTNLYYPATPGWDYATGLGTPNVALLADDFEWFAKSQAGH
jgi:subtilase family serine protease